MNGRFPNHRDSAYLLFVLELSLATCIGETRFQRWKSANRKELEAAFCGTQEPDFDVWARMRFVNRRVITAF